jgi:hypothetical protein
MGTRSVGTESGTHAVIERRADSADLDGGCAVGVVADELERSKLITEISRMMREPTMPEGTRTAGLTFIGWLARRMPGEAPHALGVPEARESERRMKAARKATR